VGLAKIGLALKLGSRRGAGARNLSPTQAEILALLQRPAGPRTPGALARELGVGLPTASEALRALAAKGLVRKERSPSDGRVVLLSLTPAGEAEAERLAGWPEFLLLALASLSPEEKAALFRAVVKLIRSLQEQGRIPVARMCVTCRFFLPNVHDDPERPHHCTFVDAPFGDGAIRLDCPDYAAAS
jgi:DNA-binding MarR family transcriptional regulator